MVSPMAITAITPRDRLQRIVDLGRKALRYWWLIAILAVVGGALSMVFAMKRPKRFQSWSTIFYQERIQSSLLSGREEVVQRNIGDKYREILLARAQLTQIISDPKLTPFPNEPDLDIAIESLRAAIKLEGRGGNAFRIVYTDGDPDRAKAVTEKLTKLLQEKDESLRNLQARETVEFATKQKDEASAQLSKDVEALTLFLSQHTEFAADANAATEGVSIRARQAQNQAQNLTPKALTSEQQRLLTLERQRQRIQDRLNAGPGAPPVAIVAPKTAERIAADGRVADAQREVAAARRELEDALGKYTPKHPTAIKAQERVDAAQQRVREAQALVPPDVEPSVPPATPEDRKKLERQRAELDQQIARLQSTRPGAPAAPVTDTDTTSWIVKLETEHSDLRRRVSEQRERVNSLADSVFRAELDARQKLAETGGRLSVVDPAFRPVKPSGPPKKLFLMAGVVLFMVMGLALAVMLAVIDDRLYRRSDLEHLGVAVLAVIPPGPKPAKAARRARTRVTKQPPPEQEAA